MVLEETEINLFTVPKSDMHLDPNKARKLPLSKCKKTFIISKGLYIITARQNTMSWKHSIYTLLSALIIVQKSLDL